MKQAVVLIHGIGEQKPMATLRAFVESVLLPAEEGREKYWSKPDPLSESFELRRLQERGRTKTHFYEYYWAYNVEGTTFGAVLAWLWDLIKRPWNDVPKSAKALWIFTRSLVIGALILAVATVIILTPSGVGDWLKGQSQTLKVAWGTLAVVASVLQGLVVLYLGDAARYLSPKPGNIRLRHAIRSQGVKLLRALHEPGRYDRIIVVGHSLGSVIGYDLISNLWQDCNDKYTELSNPQVASRIRECMDRNVSPQVSVREELVKAGRMLASRTAQSRLGFRRAQRRAWKEQRRLGNPWKISDFITLGSPLTHAMLLLACNRADFEGRKRQRELPTCPPQPDDKGYAYSGTTVDIGGGRRFTPLVLHHAAPFAVTAWTNLYCPARLGLFGDVVGGPLADAFGLGIEDVPVSTRAWKGAAKHTLVSHTKYWHAGDGLCADEPRAKDAKADGAVVFPLGLLALREALGLEFLRKYKPGPWQQLRGPTKAGPQVVPPADGAKVPDASV